MQSIQLDMKSWGLFLGIKQVIPLKCPLKICSIFRKNSGNRSFDSPLIKAQIKTKLIF